MTRHAHAGEAPPVRNNAAFLLAADLAADALQRRAEHASGSLVLSRDEALEIAAAFKRAVSIATHDHCRAAMALPALPHARDL